MSFKLFSELFDAIEKTFKAIKAIAKLPKETRDELRKTFDGTFQLLDTSLNMVSIRLGEILRITKITDFKKEVRLLKNDQSWTNAEREFRLCKSLRHTVNETDRLKSKILNYISVKDWEEMQNQMEAILQSEDRLGDYIADKFKTLSGINTGPHGSLQQTKDTLMEFQDALNAERRRLIAMEMELYNNF
jgi:hypothetical protein